MPLMMYLMVILTFVFIVLVAAANKELSSQVSSFMVCIVCHYTLVAVAQQAGS
jgi:hypothetical protein